MMKVSPRVNKSIKVRAAVLFINALLLVLLLPIGNVCAYTFWDAIFEIGYNPASRRVNPALACDRIEKIFQLNALISEHLVVDENLLSGIHDLNSRLPEMDVGDFFDVLPYTVAGSPWQAVDVQGESQSDTYKIHLANPETGKSLISSLRPAPGASGHQNRFGDMSLRTVIKPTQANTFRFQTRGELYLDDLPADNLARMLNGALQTLWAQAAFGIDSPPEFLHRSSLNQPSKKILYAIARDFPNLFELINQYVKIEHVVSQTVEYHDDSVMFDLRGQFNRDAFVTNYPEIGKLLNTLKGMLLIRSRVLDEQGRQMGALEVDSKKKSVTLRFRTFNGRLLPMHSNPQSTAYSGFSLLDKDRHQFQLISDIHLSVIGLQFEIEGLQMALDHSNGDHGLYLKANMKQSPQTLAVSGRAFGFLPVWLIDFLIPSNVEEIISDYFETLANSNDGQGAEVELGSQPPKVGGNSIWLRAEADIISNGISKIGFNFQREMPVDRQKLFAQIRAFRKQFWYAFYQDYQWMKTQKRFRQKPKPFEMHTLDSS